MSVATVSGPGIDRSYPAAGVALSAAQTFVCRTVEDVTFYIRDEAGEVLWRIERAGPVVLTHRG